MKELTVRIENNYGLERIFPVCENSKLFSEIAKTKTLSKKDIEIIKELGYVFKVEQKVL